MSAKSIIYDLVYVKIMVLALEDFSTHIYDQKVQPAPVVGEIFLEAVSDPLQKHLQHEDVAEDLVSVFQHHLHHLPLLDVNVFKRLSGKM